MPKSEDVALAVRVMNAATHWTLAEHAPDCQGRGSRPIPLFRGREERCIKFINTPEICAC
jgi:hypothetical protein